MKRLNVDLPEPLHRRLKVHCAANDKDMSSLVRWLISDYLRKAQASQRDSTPSS